MKVLALFASPRTGGFSSRLHEILVERLEQAVAEVTSLRVSDLSVSPCTACAHCRTHYSCIINDDMDMLYRLFRESDLISISSPVYFSSLPAGLKAIIERCQVFWEEKQRGEAALSGKWGSLISSGGGDYPGMFTSSVLTLRHFFNSTGVMYNEDRYIFLKNTDSLAEMPDTTLKKVEELADFLMQRIYKSSQ